MCFHSDKDEVSMCKENRSSTATTVQHTQDFCRNTRLQFPALLDDCLLHFSLLGSKMSVEPEVVLFCLLLPAGVAAQKQPPHKCRNETTSKVEVNFSSKVFYRAVCITHMYTDAGGSAEAPYWM